VQNCANKVVDTSVVRHALQTMLVIVVKNSKLPYIAITSQLQWLGVCQLCIYCFAGFKTLFNVTWYHPAVYFGNYAHFSFK